MHRSESNTAKRVILAIEALGFSAVLAVIWLDEFADIPHRVFGAAAAPSRPEEFWFETFAVLVLALLVLTVTVWFLRRIRELESFLPVCAWCKTVLVGDRWITFETYVRDHQDVTSTHGICPACRATFPAEQDESEPAALAREQAIR